MSKRTICNVLLALLAALSVAIQVVAEQDDLMLLEGENEQVS